ncbi:MAG: metallopeptidase family protein [Acidobacteria bacterium]|nr:metallopeptidase family protein [Acidobacteriota bacterium]
MRRAAFRRLVSEALEDLPVEFMEKLNNVEVVVEDLPTPDQQVLAGGDEEEMLMGLYEGTPLTERTTDYTSLPDRITLFQDNIEAVCGTDEEIREEVRKTVLHEIAHHFGMDDERLYELDY